MFMYSRDQRNLSDADVEAMWAVRADKRLSAQPRPLAIFDGGVAGSAALLDAVAPGTSVAVLPSDRPTIEALCDIVVRHGPVSELHLVAHGEPGRVLLGQDAVSYTHLTLPTIYSV